MPPNMLNLRAGFIGEQYIGSLITLMFWIESYVSCTMYTCMKAASSGHVVDTRVWHNASYHVMFFLYVLCYFSLCDSI